MSYLPSKEVRAFIYYVGTDNPPTVRGSFNVSSITDTEAGKHVINLITPLRDTNFIVIGTVASVSGDSQGPRIFAEGTDLSSFAHSRTTSSFRVTTVYTDGLTYDTSIIELVVFGY